jgi:uncharacterized protein (TIGR02145 family)
MNHMVKFALVFISILCASTLYAHNKAVVIPLNSCSDPGLIPENICVGVIICGVSGTKLCTSLNYGTVTSANNRVWLDRNLGASRVASSATDTEAYGDLYQWGRLTDGHQSRTSLTYTTPSTTDVPGHGSHILNDPAVSPYDWISPQNDNLWQGISGTNNPCPTGFRVPTKTEWETEIASWNSQDGAGAFASPLKLVMGGYRFGTGTGILSSADTYGYYWSSTVYASNGTDAEYMYFSSIEAAMDYAHRVQGSSVRCIED